MATIFQTLGAVVYEGFTTAERDALNAQERMTLYNTDSDQWEMHLSGVWRPIAILDANGNLTAAQHGTLASGDLHPEYARVAAPEDITGGWVLRSGGSLRTTPGDPPEGEVALQVKTATGAPSHSATEGTPCWVAPDDDLYVNNDGSTGWTRQAKDSSLHAQSHTLASHSTKPHSALSDAPTNAHHNKAHTHSHIMVFAGLDEDLAVGVLSPRPGINVGESGEHGTFTAVRGKAIAGTAGTGTTTILIEADDNPAFSSAVTLFTLGLNTSTEVDDTTLDTAWAAGDIFVRARATAVGATKPKDVAVMFYFKEDVI